MIDKTVRRLLETGSITPQNLQFALDEQLRTNESILKILIRTGIITEARIKDALEIYEVEDINIKEIQIPPSVLRMLPLHIIKNNKVFPIKFENNSLVLAMLDPKNLLAKDTVSMFLGKGVAIQRLKVTEEDLAFLINKFSFFLGKDKEADTNKLEETIQHAEVKESNDVDDSINKLINKMLSSALTKRASQISIEPSSENVRIRFKIYDSFYEEARLPRKMYQNVLANLKSRSGLEGEEKNFYYSGNFKFIDSDKNDVNIVINSIRTINGDKLILRPSYKIPDLKELFYYSEMYSYIRQIVEKNKGLILVIGDSGSGKSTTMYSILQHKISNSHQLLTIEDPIKYIFDNYVSQIQLRHDKVQSLPDLVREVLRHNPDVLLVQEIRDEAWVSLVEELALSGMLILAGMRAYNTISALKKLKRMNFPNFASIQCIIHQKLVKRLCQYCKIKGIPSKADLEFIGYSEVDMPNVYEANPNGCTECHGGYFEMIGLFEIVKMNRELIDTVNKSQYLNDELGKTINKACITNIKEYGTSLLMEGIISMEEFKKVF